MRPRFFRRTSAPDSKGIAQAQLGRGMALLALIMCALPAISMGQCHEFAKVGWFDTESISTNERRLYEFMSYLRYIHTGTYQEAKDLGVTVGIPVAEIMTEWGLRDSDSSFSQFKTMQEQEIRSRFEQAKSTLIQRIRINPDVVQLIKSCLQTPGLHVWRKVTPDPNALQLRMLYRKPPSGDENADVEIVAVGERLSCAEKAVSVAHGTTYTMTCIRDKSREEEVAQLDVNVSNATYIEGSDLWLMPASQFIPPPPPPDQFRYFRISFSGPSPRGRGRMGFMELRFEWDGTWQTNAIGPGCSGTIGGVSASLTAPQPSDCTNSAWAGYRAFDGRVQHGYGWEVSVFPASLTVALAQPKKVTRYSIKAGLCNGIDAPFAWELRGSNDQQDWTLLDSVNNQFAWRWDPNNCGPHGEERQFKVAP